MGFHHGEHPPSRRISFRTRYITGRESPFSDFHVEHQTNFVSANQLVLAQRTLSVLVETTAIVLGELPRTVLRHAATRAVALSHDASRE